MGRELSLQRTSLIPPTRQNIPPSFLNIWNLKKISNEHLQGPSPDRKPWISFQRFTVLPLSRVFSCHTGEVTSQCNFLFNMLVLGLQHLLLAPQPSHWGLVAVRQRAPSTLLPWKACEELPQRPLCTLPPQQPPPPTPSMDLLKHFSYLPRLPANIPKEGLARWEGKEGRARGGVMGEGAEGAQAGVHLV